MSEYCLINVDRFRKKISELEIHSKDEPMVTEEPKADRVFTVTGNGKEYRVYMNYIVIDWGAISNDFKTNK
jgi:hypothetical protein